MSKFLICLFISSNIFAICAKDADEAIQNIQERIDHVDSYNALRIGRENSKCFSQSEELKVLTANLIYDQAMASFSEKDRVNYLLEAKELLFNLSEQEEFIEEIEKQISNSQGLDSRVQKIQDQVLKDQVSDVRSNSWIIYRTMDGYAIWVRPYVVPSKGIAGKLYWYRFADADFDFMLNSACPPGRKLWVSKPIYDSKVYNVKRRGRNNPRILGYRTACVYPWTYHRNFWWPPSI